MDFVFDHFAGLILRQWVADFNPFENFKLGCALGDNADRNI